MKLLTHHNDRVRFADANGGRFGQFLKKRIDDIRVGKL